MPSEFKSNLSFELDKDLISHYFQNVPARPKLPFINLRGFIAGNK